MCLFLEYKSPPKGILKGGVYGSKEKGQKESRQKEKEISIRGEVVVVI
jgi:hypothetical protein